MSKSPPDFNAYFAAECEEHIALANEVHDQLAGSLEALVAVCSRCLASGGKLVLFGNGGSAADAQHIAAELCVRYQQDRPALAAIALTTDTSVLTAIGNDLGFDQVFCRQIEAVGRAGDVAIAFSTSGLSSNVIAGLSAARAGGLVTAGFTGKDGGDMAALTDYCLHVPSRVTSRIQEMHILLGHILCGALEAELVQGA